MARQKVILPENGIPINELSKMMEDARKEDVNWDDGKVWSLIFRANQEHYDFIKKANSMFFSKNALNPLAFPSLKKFESEVISMTIDLLNGTRRGGGNMTSGGTESILMGVKTHRDWARVMFPNIIEPEILLPSSAHPAFDKAAEYFCVKSVRVPVDGNTYRADVKAMEKGITDNTILIVGSACDFPRGVVDPITELASIAKERGIGMHVDACIGGFILPFVKELGYDIPNFDFSVPGVTSISADIHKYGYGPKGTSTITYHHEKLWKYQFSAYVNWSGGIYVSPTMRGTRPGGELAAAWAALNFLGRKGYLETTRTVMESARKLINGINQINHLYVLGKPDMSVFSFTSDKFDIYLLGDIMDKKGWTLSRLQLPKALHLIVNPLHSKKVDLFLKDLNDSVTELLNNPDKEAGAESALYGMMATIPDRASAKEFVLDFLKDIYKVK